jgi:hypothetical protein
MHKGDIDIPTLTNGLLCKNNNIASYMAKLKSNNTIFLFKMTYMSHVTEE